MSRAAPSPGRRKSAGLVDRDMNRFDNNNLTLPVTKGELTLPVTKGERKGKRGVSMGGGSIGGSLQILSETQVLRRQARPRKSILKTFDDASRVEEFEQSRVTIDYGATIDFGQLRALDSGPRASMPSTSSRMSLGPRRRVSFAPAAHVRMFDQPDKRPRRKSSMLPRQFGPTPTSNSAPQSPARSRPSLPAMPHSRSPLPASSPTSPRARFMGEGDEMSEASMDIESDHSFSSESYDESQVEASPRPSNPVPPDSSSDVDAEGEMDMDETIIGGGIVQQRWADNDTDSDSASDMSIEEDEATDEEKTMDFTVALGGPMPRQAPADAKRGRASIGYSVPSAPGEAPFLPGDGASDNESVEMEETVAYGIVYDESTSSSENSNRGDQTATYNMDFTSVGGGINLNGDESGMDMTMTMAHGGMYHDASGVDMTMTTAHGMINDNGSAMDMTMTAAHGGINADASVMDMTMTGAHGGIYGDDYDDDETGLDFTTAGGGIAHKNTNVYGTATQMLTNIFAPAPTPAAPTPAPQTGVTPAQRVNIFAPTPTTSGIPRPRGSLKPALTPFAPVAAAAPVSIASPPPADEEDDDDHEVPTSPPRRARGSSSTPARPTPGTPGRKSRPQTPSFARPTSSSTQKTKDAPPSAQKSRDPPSAKKKRNIFGASPEPEDEPPVQLSRSKSRTPRKSMQGLEVAVSVAKKLDFSAASGHSSAAGTPAVSAPPTPKGSSPKVTPKVATPKSKPAPRASMVSTTPIATLPSTTMRAQASTTPAAPPRSTTSTAIPRVSTTPRVAPPSSLKRARVEDAVEAETEVKARSEEDAKAEPVEDLHRSKRRRSSISAPPVNVLTENDTRTNKRRRSSIPAPPPPAGVSTEEEDMELEDENAPTEDTDELSPSGTPEPETDGQPWLDERHITPEREVEERPLPSYTPIARGTPGRATPRRSLGMPRKSLLGPPRRSMVSFDPEEPKREPEPVDLMTHLPSQPGIEVQNIPLSAFLEMVGISWQDDLIGRKSLGPKLDLKSSYPKGHEFSLPEYVEANLESIFLSMLSWANNEITSKTAQGKEILTTIEHVCSEENPPVVHDYLAADEDDRGMFESVLLQIKSVTYLRAKARWYDWKQSILSDKVEADVRGIRDDMLGDAERHKIERETIDKILPDLRGRRDELEAELAAHRAQVQAVLECDPEEIAALREGIDEQEIELERFRAELDAKTTRNAETELQLATLETQGTSHAAAIDAARSMCDQLTVSDVLRLEAELAALQDLHGWRILRAGGRLELSFGELLVSVPCFPEPALEQASLALSLSLSLAKDGADAGLLVLAQTALKHKGVNSLSGLVNSVTQLWSAARSVRDELRRLALYYPSSYEVVNDHLVVMASVMLPKARAKASLRITLGHEVLLGWPEAVRALPVDVSPAYGKIDAIGLRERARETLRSADLSLAGVLFQACAEAAALYA